MLQMENVSVKVEGKDILKRVSLEIGEAEIHALLGPNASGKSTLAYAVAGFPNYQITEGRICFRGKDLVDLPIEERAKLGIALVFQHPPVVKGVKLSKLLERISKQRVDVSEFPMNPDLLRREINNGFSGGERKLSEIIQVISLNPSLVIFDELDAGLDIENLEKLASVIKDKLFSNGVSVLLITHRGDILRFLEPHIAHVMLDGKIIGSSENWRKTWETIKEWGYEKCKECPLSSA